MSRKEKYYNYIVNDLMKDTYQSDTDRIHTPVRYEGDGEYYLIHEPFHENIVYLLNQSTNFQPDLFMLLQEKFGVTDNDWGSLRDLYRDTLLKKFPNWG